MRAVSWWFVAHIGLFGCGGTTASGPAGPGAEANGPAGQVQLIDVADLKQKLDAGEIPILVDVRTPGERARGSVPGSVGIPLSELSSRVGELDAYREGPVYLVCQSGRRSQRAAELLAGQGFTAVNVTGGTSAWQAKGWPVE